MVNKFRVSTIKSVLILLALTVMGHSYARTVKSIEIDTVGLNLESVKNENAARACKRFRPTKDQAIRFFNRAYPVETYVLTTDRFSSCYAEGSLKFSDGSFGKWILYSSGTALFTFNRGDVVNLYYKHNKWHDPYACTYGLSDQREC